MSQIGTGGPLRVRFSILDLLMMTTNVLSGYAVSIILAREGLTRST